MVISVFSHYYLNFKEFHELAWAEQLLPILPEAYLQQLLFIEGQSFRKQRDLS